MSDDDTEWRLLAAIRAQPDDDDLRSAYADWLDERGDPRGDYLRQDIEVHRTKRPTPTPNQLRWKVRSIDAEWIAAIARRFDVVLVGHADRQHSWDLLQDVLALSGKGEVEHFDVRRFGLGDPQRLLSGVPRREADAFVARYAPHLRFEIAPRHPFE